MGVIKKLVEAARMGLALISCGTHTDPQQITNNNDSNQCNLFSATFLSTIATDPPNTSSKFVRKSV